MARLAWSNAARAMRDARLIEARGWTRLHEDLTRIAADDDDRRRRHLRWAEDPASVRHIPVAPPLRPIEED